MKNFIKILMEIKFSVHYNYSENELFYEFFMVLCAAHECIIDIEEKKSYIVYQGMSPDEITLVDAASRLGF